MSARVPGTIGRSVGDSEFGLAVVDTGAVVILRTSRLVLRPFRAGDMAAVLAYRNDPSVARFQGWPQPFTEVHFRQLMEPERRLAETGWMSWCICDAHGVTGDIGLRPNGDDAEIGISLAPVAQGRGYALEALERLSEHAFADVRVEHLYAGVNPANSQVIRLFVRAGWRHEGTAVKAYWHRDHWDDDATYGLSRLAWERRRADLAHD